MDLSADQDDPNDENMNADKDQGDEPTPVEPAGLDTSTAVASAPTSSSAMAAVVIDSPLFSHALILNDFSGPCRPPGLSSCP